MYISNENLKMTAIIHLLLVCALVQLFTHCCVYSEWSEWTYVNGSEVADPACPSGVSHNVTRSRYLTGLPWGCEEFQTETDVNCTTRADIFIRYLGLGAADTQNLQPLAEANNIQRRSAAGCPSITGEHSYLCRDLYKSIGRRSVRRKHTEKKECSTSSALPLVRKCKQDDIQYILFLIDTSGSIGSYNFSRLTEAIGNVTAYFCKPIRVAVMTFNHHFRLEFCFNCYDNNERSSISQAIKNIQYREGLTYSAAAARCACMEVLNETCGLPDDAECIDVVVITDGQSNDPFLQICEEVECLHRRALNTYVLAIGDHDADEIKCITQEKNEVHVLFDLWSIDDLIDLLEEVAQALQMCDEYSCINGGGIPDSI